MEDFADVDYDALFGSDSGEDEDPSALRGYFVDIPQFKKFYNPADPLVIVRGRKGMGKSALLKRQAIKLKDLNDPNTLIVSVTGNELIGLGDFKAGTQAYFENHWKQVICKRIFIEIARRINFPVNDNILPIVEVAEIEAFKGANIVDSLCVRLQSMLNGHGRFDASLGKLDESPALQALSKFRLEGTKTVWLLIDDVDAKYVDDDESQLRVGAFFSAVRSLAFTIEGLKIRSSVRTDVWKNLRKMEDQDKIRGYVIDIHWKDNALRSIIAKRILSYLRRIEFSPAQDWDTTRHYENILGQVFVAAMPWDKKNVEPFLPIKILAGGRPRWMGQLCKLAGLYAGTSLIRMENIRAAMHEFGGEKISDIQKEHLHQFADLSKLLDIFRSGKREYNRFQLLNLIEVNYIEKVEGLVPPVNGYPYQKTDQLGEFLFQIDFLSAHDDGGTSYFSFNDEPDLFQAEENHRNKVKWTVNASYRNFLRIA